VPTSSTPGTPRLRILAGQQQDDRMPPLFTVGRLADATSRCRTTLDLVDLARARAADLTRRQALEGELGVGV
jgi:hypothetical protein